MASSLLDTDTLSAIMRQNPIALTHAQTYLAVHQQFIVSLVTRYEVLRGLKVKNAAVQQLAFDQFCVANIVLPLTDNIIQRAAGIYAELYRHGTIIGDADILIAATALEHGLQLVTNNTNHFNRVATLQLQNWLIA